jgi:hypothetical protein
MYDADVYWSPEFANYCRLNALKILRRKLIFLTFVYRKRYDWRHTRSQHINVKTPPNLCPKIPVIPLRLIQPGLGEFNRN